MSLEIVRFKVNSFFNFIYVYFYGNSKYDVDRVKLAVKNKQLKKTCTSTQKRAMLWVLDNVPYMADYKEFAEKVDDALINISGVGLDHIQHSASVARKNIKRYAKQRGFDYYVENGIGK